MQAYHSECTFFYILYYIQSMNINNNDSFLLERRVLWFALTSIFLKYPVQTIWEKNATL